MIHVINASNRPELLGVELEELESRRNTVTFKITTVLASARVLVKEIVNNLMRLVTRFSTTLDVNTQLHENL